MGAGGEDLPDPKRVGPEPRVTTIRRRADGYDVVTADGAAEN